jgi:hypothetical protein
MFTSHNHYRNISFIHTKETCHSGLLDAWKAKALPESLIESMILMIVAFSISNMGHHY